MNRAQTANAPPILQIDCTHFEHASCKGCKGCSSQLIDYRSRRASLAAEESSLYKIRQSLRSSSRHEKRLALLRHGREQKTKPPTKEEPPHDGRRTSMLDLVPPGHAGSTDGNDSNSQDDVIFSLKVKKSRYIRTRRSSVNPNQSNSSSGSIQLWDYSSRSNMMMDESMALQSVTKPLSLEDDNDEDDDEMIHHPSIRSIAFEDLPASARYHQSSSNTRSFTNRANWSQQTCLPNQNSFQMEDLQAASRNNTSSMSIPDYNFPVVKRTGDPRKLRRSMMNWLINRKSTRNLMAPPSKDPKPPAFVKVIHLHDHFHDEDDKSIDSTRVLDQDRQIQAWLTSNHDKTLMLEEDGLGCTAHSRLPLDASHHRRFASSTA